MESPIAPGIVPPRPIVVIGDANPDLVLHGDVRPRFGQVEQLADSADLVLGGSAAITACGTARLGVPTSLIAAIGDDTFGRFVTDQLAAGGVDIACLVTRTNTATGLSVILSTPDDRAILTCLGTIPTLGPADVRGPFVAPAHLHASSFFLLSTFAAALATVFSDARANGVTTSLDTNWDPAEQWTGVHDVLAHCDLFFPNDRELLAIVGGHDVAESGARLAQETMTTVVAKCGADGGRLWSPDGLHLHHRPRPTTVVDTTGAGDSFNAGYLAGYVRGLGPDRCLALAVAAGRLSTRGSGGTAFQASWDELERELEPQFGEIE